MGQLRVCIWPEYYGITFRNPKSGELSGIDEMLSVSYTHLTLPTSDLV